MVQIRERQWRHEVFLFSVDVQCFTTGDQGFQAGRGRQQLTDQWRSLDDLFKVVQQQKQMSPAKMILEAFYQGLSGCFSDTKHLSNRTGDVLRIADGCQVDEEDTIRKSVEDLRGYLQTQPRLSRAGGTGERQEAGRCQQLHDLADLTLAPDERGDLRGEVVLAGRHSRQNRHLQLAIADLLVQPRRFFGWLDAQFFSQEAATGLVLSQGGAALAPERQRSHQLSVGRLIPGLQFDLPPGTGLGLLVLAASLVGCRQAMEHGRHLPGESLPCKQRPFLKGGAVPD